MKKIDVARITHAGGHIENKDNSDYAFADSACETLCVALCDGLNGSRSGGEASRFCVTEAMTLLKSGIPPREALAEVLVRFEKAQAEKPELAKAGSTSCLARISDGEVQWATLGDSRIYLFRSGELHFHSSDDSVAYADFIAGKWKYEDLRLHPDHSRLTRCIGSAGVEDIHSGKETFASGDALILCSDGFWQYVYETEISIDLAKAESARNLLSRLMIRLTERSALAGDNLTLIVALAK